MKTTAALIGLTAFLSGCVHRDRSFAAGRVPAAPEPSVDASPATAAEIKTAAPVQPRETAPDPPIVSDLSRPSRPADQLLAEINARLEDAYFDYDQHALRDDAQAALRHNASLLRDVLLTFRDPEISVEGHCDERGSAEYNLALGDLRGRAAMEFLALQGVGPDRLQVISYGREKPQCSAPAESCWQKNRRAHLSLHPAPTIH